MTSSRVVPGSQRPDGSFRKDIRIRDGYVCQDEIPKYEPIALREEPVRRLLPPPGSEPLYPESANCRLTRKQNSQQRTSRSCHSQRLRESDGKFTGSERVPLPETARECSPDSPTSHASATSGIAQNKLRALRKKLRRIEELETKMRLCTLQPNNDQQMFLSKKAALEAEVRALLSSSKEMGGV